tara:strand:+ start:1434 stop:2084 length:651 start_codon:yes stop_codon:yes gene_type:complete
MTYLPQITLRILTGSITISLAACVSYWVLSLISPSHTAALSLGQYLNNLLHADFGRSQFYHLPNLQVIVEKLPATFELVIITSLIVALFALPLGLYTAIAPRQKLARGLMAFSLLGISLPVFLTGSLMVYLFAVELNWLPAFGRGDLVWLMVQWLIHSVRLAAYCNAGHCTEPYITTFIFTLNSRRADPSNAQQSCAFSSSYGHYSLAYMASLRFT